MARKLKTLTATRVSGGGYAPVVYSPLEYVPAEVAQGLLDALFIAQWGEGGMWCPWCGGTYLDGHHRDCKIGNAIAAATEE